MLKTKRDKKARWENKRARIKYKLLKGTKSRLVVYRSNRHIFAQIVDDNNHSTLVAASSIDKEIEKSIKSADSKMKQSEIVGEAIALKAKENKITEVIFDRNGYKYHGVIKAIAESSKKAGLKF